jgi:hypothetical protein
MMIGYARAVSLLNDFFLASDEELDSFDTSHGPWPPSPEPPKKRFWQRRAAPRADLARSPRLPVIEAKGILDVELATLERILHGETLEDLDAVLDLIQEPVRQDPESDPSAWIAPVSDRLVTALAATDEPALRRAADAWSQTEEMQASGWTQSDAADLLVDLSDFCRRAQTEGRRVYRWFSL